MLTLDFVETDAARLARAGLALVSLNDGMWRVTLPEGDVLGYIERFSTPGGQRYRAKRFLPSQRRFLIDGEFWAMDDAIACFRSLTRQ